MLFAFFGCERRENAGSLRVLELPASVQIEGERNGVAFSADLTFGGGEGKLVFSAPESMKGIAVSTAGGVWGSSLDGIPVSGGPAELLGAPLKVFIDRGEVISAKSEGEGYTLIAARAEGIVREYLIENKSGLPAEIKEMSADGALIMKLKIKNYEFKEE